LLSPSLDPRFSENSAKIQADVSRAFETDYSIKICLMARIRVIFESGEPDRVIDFNPADAPFHHDGRPGSILDVLLGHGVHLEHACGGNCACTTCHVIVKKGYESLSEPSEQEEDMLDRAPGLTPTSRLGCQAVPRDADAEIVIIVPRFTINQLSERSG
jgi:2Fe-2S ferredoxin